MSQVCRCGSPLTVRHGSASDNHLRLDGMGKVGRVPCISTRFLCKACRVTFMVRHPAADEADREARDHVRELAFLHGRSGAGRITGLERPVVRRLLDEWQAAREGETIGVAPDFILVERAPVRGGEALLVGDIDGGTLIEVLAGQEAMGKWLGSLELPPLRACVPVDAAIAASVRSHLPEAAVMVAPSAVARAIATALGAGLRLLKRSPDMRNRNAFPGVARFLRAHEGKAVCREGWPTEVVSLLSAGRLARDIAAAADTHLGERLWREFDVAVATPGGAPLARFMGTWRQAILNGLGHRYVDGTASMMARVRRLATVRRPTLVLNDFRALVLLRDYQGRTSVAWGNGSRTLGQGRSLAGLEDLLRGAPG